MAVLAAEMVGLKNGLGMMIILGREMFNPKLILLGMCMVGATGYLVDALLVQIQRKILRGSPRNEDARVPACRQGTAVAGRALGPGP